MEKRIIIGRGTDCDVTIPDETDNVSRHHLVISFNIFGKMKISDTSSNGTFINDNRMLRGSSVPVTRNDKIRLGAQWELDWNLVIDPFCKIRKAIIACLVAVVLALVGWGIYCAVSPKADDSTKIIIPKAETNSTDEQWNGDSTKHVVPIDERISVGNAARKQSGTNAGKGKSLRNVRYKSKGTNGKADRQYANDNSKEISNNNQDKSSGKNITIVN